MSLVRLFSLNHPQSRPSEAGKVARRSGNKQSAKERLKLLEDFENSGLGWFWATDELGRLSYVSNKAAEQLGVAIDDLLGQPLTALFELDRTEDGEETSRPLKFLVTARTSISDSTVKVATGRNVWWTITGKPQLNAAGNFVGYRGSAKDISADYERRREAARLARYDSLTGLANRHHITSRLEAILRASIAGKRSCALLMLDLDRFKHVNDTLGHPAGDELLKQMAGRLERIIGKHGEIGRLGGDEFQVILPDIDDRGRLGELADRVIQMLSQPYSIEGSRAIIGASVGIAVAPYDGLTSSDLNKAADLALYASKAGGRGQYRFYSDDLKDSAEERRTVEEDLRDALAGDQIKLFYQPVVSATDHLLSGFEALMRWEHPERGMISPAVFIPIAEESNLINQLGEWALRKACSDAASWPGKLRVAVNVSAPQFAQDGFTAIVTSALASAGLDPSQLELEITESVFVGELTAVEEKFRSLKKLGVRLALDDFGTGYSSLSYLRNSPFDKIKIDQSFVRGCLDTENSSSAIITAIISMAHALKMETTAEGVEALDQLAHICGQGATYIQGWVFSKAMPPAQVLEKLESGNLSFKPTGPKRYRAERRSVFRRAGVVHEDEYYEVVLRNLSKSGALIEGLINVPSGTRLVLDLGAGQLIVATVRRSNGEKQGLSFEVNLISDGADGWMTRHRVSPYALAAAGMPLAALPPGRHPLGSSSERQLSLMIAGA